MPIFEFECLSCGAVFERLMKRSGTDDAVVCPKCGSRRVEEKLSTFSSTSSAGASGSGSCAPGGG